MSAMAERAVSTRRSAPREIIRDFSPAELKAPFALRCGAKLLDYIILVAVPVTALLLGRMAGTGSDVDFQQTINSAAWLITVLLIITNLFLFPILSGQTIGMMLTGIRIVNTSGGRASTRSILIRHSIGYLLTLLTFGLGFVITLFNSQGRALHDYLAGTVVVHGRPRVMR